MRVEGEEAVAGVVRLLTGDGIWRRARDLDSDGIPVPHGANLLCVFLVHPRFEFGPAERSEGMVEGVGGETRLGIRLGGQAEQLGLAVVEGEAVGGGVG